MRIVKGLGYITTGVMLIVSIMVFVTPIVDYILKLKTVDMSNEWVLWFIYVVVVILSWVWGGVLINKGYKTLWPPKEDCS